MELHPDCFHCTFSQAYRYAHELGLDRMTTKSLLDDLARVILATPITCPQTDFIHAYVQTILQYTNGRDPYRELRKLHTGEALALLPRLRDLVRESSSPLLTAIRIALAGNIIDLGPNQSFDLEAELGEALHRPLTVCDLDAFIHAVRSAEYVLYIGDNAGETVFDRVLIETLGLRTIYAVRGGPFLNDALFEDALEAGLDQVAEITTTGAAFPGALLEICSPEFLRVFRDAPMIISKGMGNFEALCESQGPLFFLLKVKCPPVAQHIGTHVGSMVLLAAQHLE